jgi:hypothetical protein
MISPSSLESCDRVQISIRSITSLSRERSEQVNSLSLKPVLDMRQEKSGDIHVSVAARELSGIKCRKLGMSRPAAALKIACLR